MWALDVIDRNTVVAGGRLGVLIKREVTYKPTADYSPNFVDFGKVSAPKETSVQITAANQAGLRIDGFSIDDPIDGFSIVSPKDGFPIELAEGESVTATIRFDPAASAGGKVFSALLMDGNDFRGTPLPITLVAETASEQPTVQVDVTEVDFGTTELGKSAERTITISAANALGLRIDTLWVEDIIGGPNGFEVIQPSGGFPIDITENDPLEVLLRFTPITADIELTSELVIVSNDPDNPETGVTLRGEGNEPISAVGEESHSDGDVITVRSGPNPIARKGMVYVRTESPMKLRVALYNMLGNRVLELFDGTSPAGTSEFPLEVAGLPPGVYHILVMAPDTQVVHSIVVRR
jgi:hypothetical protein